jgi:multiple sugar transport system substrate-binding protein
LKRALFTSLMLAVCLNVYAQKQVLTVAAFPAVDKIVKDSVAEWKKTHPNVEVNVVSRAYADHHTAMTTALVSGCSVRTLVCQLCL